MIVEPDYDVKKRKCALANKLNVREFLAIEEVDLVLKGDRA